MCLHNPYAVTVNPSIGYTFEIEELNTPGVLGSHMKTHNMA